MDNIKAGVHLFSEANDLFLGGFSFNKMAEAQDLYAGATNFFRSFKHRGEAADGLEEGDYASYAQEHKMVTMFSGCRDDQTSADANIGGMSEGAMSWAFLETMKRFPNPNLLEVRLILPSCGRQANRVKSLQDTRYNLRNSQYTQVPQLSMGVQVDLGQPLVL